jgi:FecR protein
MADGKQPGRRTLVTSRRTIAAVVAALAGFATGLPAAVPGTAPAGAPATGRAATGPAGAGGGQRIKVTEATGRLTVISTDGGMTWQPVKVDMEADPGAIFRTGPRSSITCLIQPGDQRFTVESLTKITVAEASRSGNRAKTDLVMDRGAVRYDIQAAGAVYESTVRTPSSTLAVRGTRTFVEDRVPFAPFAVSYTGVVEYTTAQKTARFGGRRVAAVRAGDGSAAQTALNETVVDPSIARARTQAESQLIADQTSRGGIVGFDAVANIPVVRGGSPQTDQEISRPSAQPGRLSIFLRWTGDADLNSVHTSTPLTSSLIRQGRQLAQDIPFIGQANLNDTELGQVAITFGGQTGGVTLQEVLYPGFDLNTTPSGGRIPFDHRGGAGGGQEVAFWIETTKKDKNNEKKTFLPPGVYGIGAQHISGAPADFKLDAFLDGRPLDIFFTQGVDANGLPLPVKTQTYTGTLSQQGEDAAGAIIYVPGNSFFESITPDADPSGAAGADPQNPQAVARKLIAEGNAKAAKGTASARVRTPAARTPAAALSTPVARKKELQTATAKATKPSAFRTSGGSPRVTGARDGRPRANLNQTRNELRVAGPRGR